MPHMIEFFRNTAASPFGKDWLDVDDLRGQAAAVGKANIVPIIDKRKATFTQMLNIKFKISNNSARSISEIVTGIDSVGNVKTLLTGDHKVRGSLKLKSDPAWSKLKEIMRMFEDVDPNASTFEEYGGQNCDATYTHFSTYFVTNHCAADMASCKTKAENRRHDQLAAAVISGKTANPVPYTFLLPADAVVFNDEIRSTEPLISLIINKYRNSILYRAKNKKVTSIAIGSVRPHTQQKCTNDKGWVPETISETIYYGIADAAVTGGGNRIACSHFQAKFNLMTPSGSLIGSWKKLNLAKLVTGSAVVLDPSQTAYATFGVAD